MNKGFLMLPVSLSLDVVVVSPPEYHFCPFMSIGSFLNVPSEQRQWRCFVS